MTTTLSGPPRILGRGFDPGPARRAYDRGFNWAYIPDPSPVPGYGSPNIPVQWGDLSLNPGDLQTGLCLIIENVEGWLDSPPLAGNDQARAIADGAMWGPKTLGARVITLTGVAIGPRDQLGAVRDILAAMAAAREPADLAITDSGIGRTLTASVRAGTDSFRHTWLGPLAFRWSVVLTAADPALYGDWQQVAVSAGAGVDTGRTYQRKFTWTYGAPSLPNQATLTNDGNWPASVLALYQGDLDSPTITDDTGSALLVDDLAAGMEIQVDTGTLTAIAAGGLSRASYVLPGSVPLLVPAATTTSWHLATTGAGQVILSWRSAWV